MDYVPSRGDVVWLSFDPQAGHEPAGRRPAVVLSPHRYNGRVGLVLCCPVTSRQKGYPFEVPIPDGLEVAGVALADQIKSLDWRSRKATFLAQLPTSTVLEILQKVWTLVDARQP